MHAVIRATMRARPAPIAVGLMRCRHGHAAPCGPHTLVRARRGLLSATEGQGLFPLLCGRYAPAAWPALRACYPIHDQSDVERAIEIVIDGIAGSGAFPVMDARQRQWRQMEIDEWRAMDNECDAEGEPVGDEPPFWTSYIPITNEATLYWCPAGDAPILELLLADIVADDECKDWLLCGEIEQRLASPATPRDVARRVGAIQTASRVLPSALIAEALRADRDGILGQLPGGLARLPRLCEYMDGSFDNPFLCPSREMWDATDLDSFPWSWHNVEVAAAWWDHARPVVVDARAVLRALARPAAALPTLAAITGATIRACVDRDVSPPADLLACVDA